MHKAPPFGNEKRGKRRDVLPRNKQAFVGCRSSRALRLALFVARLSTSTRGKNLRLLRRRHVCLPRERFVSPDYQQLSRLRSSRPRDFSHQVFRQSSRYNFAIFRSDATSGTPRPSRASEGDRRHQLPFQRALAAPDSDHHPEKARRPDPRHVPEIGRRRLQPAYLTDLQDGERDSPPSSLQAQHTLASSWQVPSP